MEMDQSKFPVSLFKQNNPAEKCHILELANSPDDSGVSIVRARGEAGEASTARNG